MNAGSPFFTKLRTFEEGLDFLLDAYARTSEACAENVEDGRMSIETAQSCVEKLATCVFILKEIANEEGLRVAINDYLRETNRSMLDNA